MISAISLKAMARHRVPRWWYTDYGLPRVVRMDESQRCPISCAMTFTVVTIWLVHSWQR
ncbi:MAG: hypothetical protein ABSG14_13285 [Verrucomicrobiia bacterium]